MVQLCLLKFFSSFLSSADFFFQINFLEKYNQSVVEQFGSRSGLTFSHASVFFHSILMTGKQTWQDGGICQKGDQNIQLMGESFKESQPQNAEFRRL